MLRHYQLRSSTFADQLSTCNTDGACFAKNDSPFACDGEIHIRLINVVSGASADTKKGALSLAAGPNTAKWFCAEAATEAATESAQHAVEAASTKSKYDIHYAQIPLDQQNFTTAAGVAGEAKCEARCDANKACLGFTYIGWPQNPTTGQCYFYAHVPELKNYPGADWFQKPAAHIPAPPPPKPCLTPPTEPTCTAWADTAAWKKVGCAVGGGSCVVSIEVTNSTGGRAMINILPFQPPRAMTLPKATVTATVEKAGSNGLIPITVSATATAMFVVLTTAAEGRFSDNAFLLEAGKDREIMFIPWKEMNGQLKVRVEHLADNLAE